MTAVDEAIAALQVFKNVILEGPPGTGKSFSVADIAASWPRELGTNKGGEPASGNGSWAVTFHPSTSYEEFVEGIRYNPDPVDPKNPKSKPRGFELRSGVFRDWIEAARADPDKDFLVLIDEVNRANVSKVLGDLLLGLEASKRLRHDPACVRTDRVHVACWSGGATTQLAYSNELLGVPENLYVLGTMNSSDRSIAPLDSALRRRFAFVRVPPMSGDELRGRLEAALPEVGDEIIARSVLALDNINQALGLALGPNSMLGHSYLFELGPAFGAPRFWMEVDSSAVQTGSQLQVTKDWANRLLGAASPGTTVDNRGQSVDLEVRYDGRTFNRVRLENPNNGNVRFSANSTHIPFSAMDDGVTIWTPVGLREVTLEYLPFGGHEAAILTQYRARSDWEGRTSTRRYGKFRSATDGRGDDLEKTVWRYSILPQLLENLMQAFSPELLITGLREIWLRENLAPDAGAKVIEAMADFDDFLMGHLGLQIVLSGHGLSAGPVVEEVDAQANLLTAGSDKVHGETLGADDAATVAQASDALAGDVSDPDNATTVAPPSDALESEVPGTDETDAPSSDA
ncbi:McrB family protein [Terrabacter sp. GCM10028922]|uniref:McrB family protein n=1 Tax=Terrabacter sp. GCM10028922 TaxID=3273428 RepID=UPI0036170F37